MRGEDSDDRAFPVSRNPLEVIFNSEAIKEVCFALVFSSESLCGWVGG